jgi:hypothetical protein
MFKTKSEKILAFSVLFFFMIAVGYTVFNKIGADLSVIYQDIGERIEDIQLITVNKKTAISYTEKHVAMKKELAVEGNESEQVLKVRQDILAVFTKVGLSNVGDYQQIIPRDTAKEEDFKVISYSIAQIVCTPQQLGQLLYELEKSSNVIEINSCVITNKFSELGQLVGDRRLQANAQQYNRGLLSVDLEISRLVDYKKGEAPVRKGRRS